MVGLARKGKLVVDHVFGQRSGIRYACLCVPEFAFLKLHDAQNHLVIFGRLEISRQKISFIRQFGFFVSGPFFAFLMTLAINLFECAKMVGALATTK